MVASRRPLVAANWKLNGSLSLCQAFASDLKVPHSIDVWVFPSALHVYALRQMVSHDEMSVGVQSVHDVQSGAYTGEISAALAHDVDATAAIVGHSERRLLFKEDNQEVARKYDAVREIGLKPILCVGETADERRSGKAEEIVKAQLSAIRDSGGESSLVDSTIAYEPVWAIGTGDTATPAQAQHMHRYIRSLFEAWEIPQRDTVRIIYGGSVNPDNAQSLISEDDVDGFLVGGASLDVDKFQTICEAAA